MKKYCKALVNLGVAFIILLLIVFLVPKLFKVDNKITLLGGVIGAFITFTVIKSISGLGIAKAEVTIVVGGRLL